MPSDPVEAEKLEFKKMKTLERRARMSELQRFRKAQVSDLKLIPGPFFYNFTWWSNEYAHNYIVVLATL